MSDHITLAVELLNDALARDPEAITGLVNMRVNCNDALAAHPTIQVNRYGDVHRIGILGLLNGALGGGPSGDIGAKGRLDPVSGKFLDIKRFVDLRVDKVDMFA